jgi:hypothetical protein
MDFAKIVEVFDASEVSFVSVTQQFNTTTSMGRLTLNVLLSFAQFEREVTAERIRDKIAASKKKGLWMGGPAPLGYDVDNKQLVVNEAEACTVCRLFNLYLEFGSVRRLKEAADKSGIATKRRKTRDGRMQGGKPFSRGNLYQLLSNLLYIGRVPHRGETYPGKHQPIVDHQTWNAVRQLMASNAVDRRASSNTLFPSLLTGLIFDETGDRLSPTHAVKKGRRYRYYVSHRLMQARREHADGWRLPARELENTVCSTLASLLADAKRLIDALKLRDRSPPQQQQALRHAGHLAGQLTGSAFEQQRKLLRATVNHIVIQPGRLTIDVNRSGLADLVAGSDEGSLLPSSAPDDLRVEAPFEIKRRGVEARLVLARASERKPDETLVILVAKAHRWINRLTEESDLSVTALAAREAVDRNEISRALPVAFLAPDIVEAILSGAHPVDLTATRLERMSVPFAWTAQRDLLGFGNPARWQRQPTLRIRQTSGCRKGPTETNGQITRKRRQTRVSGPDDPEMRPANLRK